MSCYSLYTVMNYRKCDSRLAVREFNENDSYTNYPIKQLLLLTVYEGVE